MLVDHKQMGYYILGLVLNLNRVLDPNKNNNDLCLHLRSRKA